MPRRKMRYDDPLENYKRLAEESGLDPEEVAEKIREAEEEVEHLKVLMAMENDAKAHRPTKEEPFELGGAISVKHIKDILSYLPDDIAISLDHPAFVALFNQLHHAGVDNIIAQATTYANFTDEEIGNL